MKAIIYAAGRGTRLQSDRPKILLELGGRTLLQWHALRLSEAGVRDVVLVTGHLRNQIAETLPGICDGYDFAVREIVNPRFHEGRFLDLILSFPQTLMLLTLAPVLTDRTAALLHVPPPDNRAKITLIAVILGVFGFPFFARIVRGQVLSLREREFVEAARSLGASSRRIYVKELLPHLWAPLLVYITLTLPQNIAAEAALGFLGVGIQAPTPSLGALLNDSVTYALPDPAYFIIPGLTVFLLVLAFNLLGDGLRDALDPKAGRS